MNSIRRKLFVIMMAMIVFVFAVIAICQTAFLDDVYVSKKKETIQSIQQEVINAIDGVYLNLKNDTISSITEQGLCIIIYVNDRDVIYLDEQLGSKCSFSNFRHQMANRVHYENFNNANTYSVELQQEGYEEYSFLMLHDNVKKDNIKYSIVTSVSLLSMKEAQGMIGNMLIWIFLAIFLCSFVVVAAISKRITQPLIRLGEATEKISLGDFGISLPAKSRDEIGRLEQNFNKMAKDLSATETLRRDLIANISHDLRTPLTMIKGYAETIRDITGENKEKREKQVGVIIEESDRLSRLIEDILALSKMQSGSISLIKNEFTSQSFITDLLKPYEMYEEQGYTISADVMPATLFADEQQTGQVMLNLLNNAIKHTGEDGNIFIKGYFKENGAYQFEVTDTGKGIEKDEIPFIWDRYYKARNAKDKLMGTGIGLSIVKEILNAHELPYGVSSGVGNGTTFWFEVCTKNIQSLM